MNDEWKNKLPEHTPPNDTWTKISDALVFEDFLNEKKQQLPQHQPKSVSWSNIESRLPHLPKQRFWVSVKWLAAASILLFISVLWLFKTPAESVEISYSSEIQSKKNTPIEPVGIDEIDRRCNQLKLLCKRPEIKELREEIDDLDKEDDFIKEQMEMFGTDTDLQAARRRVQQKKAELAKEILELMNNYAKHS